MHLLLISDLIVDGKVEPVTTECDVSGSRRYRRPIFDILDLLLQLGVLPLVPHLKLSLMINEEAADHILAEEFIIDGLPPSPKLSS